MKKRQFLLICLILFPILLMANKGLKNVRDKWNPDVCEDRSINGPCLSMDENAIYIYSEKQLDNLDIAITDHNGCIVHAETIMLWAGVDYLVCIDWLPQGEYYILVMQGEKYIMGQFTKD